MIRKLSIENFYSIKEKQCLDFQIPSNAPDIPRFAFQNDVSSKRYPQVVALFGANASGKTTILRAISFVHWFIRYSFDSKPTINLVMSTFAQEDYQNKPTKFEIEFDSDLFDEKICVYRYTLELENSTKFKISNHLNLNPIVKSEKLYYAPNGKFKRLFTRDYDVIKDSPEFRFDVRKYPEKTFRENVSVVATLAQYAHKTALELTSRMSLLQSNVSLIQNFEFDLDSAIDYYATNEDALNKLNTKIRMLDLGIDEIVLKHSEGKESKPYFRHSGLSSELSYATESRGTQSFFTLFPYINYVLDTGGVVILDEIDNDIHPMLLPEIVSWFQNITTNPYRAQLIMACHNASILEDLEKEEIFFSEKSSTGATTIYGLKEFSGIRRVDNYYKKYLGGVFGAVPNVG